MPSPPGTSRTQVISPLAQSATAMHISTRLLFLGRVAPAAQPDHRVSDLPHGRPPKRALNHLTAGSSQPPTTVGRLSCVYQVQSRRRPGNADVIPDQRT
ncbi:conserved hypothetical protein [Streptomyces viridochromogenes DSM 40736]|uniref:Uncharacterized protein n=1 Tax=Streptomyces viridochromogenes (strain DSM 40736 / JCM 4977 / BCRC 1201 / Tue 494) TaxID=591159 RepID=D9X6W9_STRVT|nr:conserved hypothetical protein [Streptomyces viridochromogenes DSM 40736]